MNQLSNTLRLFVELIVIIALTEACVMFALPQLALGQSWLGTTLLDCAMLVMLAGPAIAWRLRCFSRRAGKYAGAETPRKVLATVAGVLVCGFVTTQATVYIANRSVHDVAGVRFDRAVERILHETGERLGHTIDGLQGAKGLYLATGTVTRGEFGRFVEALDISNRYPGIHGFGFIQRVATSDLPAFVAAERADAAPEFEVKMVPSSVPGNNSNSADDHYVVKFIEPLDANRKAQGSDVGSEEVRRTAIEQAVHSGRPRLTRRIQLVQDGTKRPGFLFLLPVFKSGINPATTQERHASLVGVLYSPIILDEIMEGVVSSLGSDLDLELRDAGELDNEAPLYSSRQTSTGVIGSERTSTTEPMFETRKIMDVGGRTWTLVASTTPAWESGIDRSTPLVLGICGILLSGLCAGVAWSMGMSRIRALGLARQMTEDLALAKTAAEDAFREVGEFRNTLEVHTIVSVADRSGKIIRANQKFCELSGYSEVDLIGQDHRVLNSGFHPKSFWVDVWKSLAAGKAWHGEVCNRAKDGSLYWVDSIIAPFCNAEGKIEKYVSIRTDITAQKEAETAIAENERRFRTLVEDADVIVWEFDWGLGVFTYVSPQAYTIGYSLEQWLQKGFWAEHIHPDDRVQAVTQSRAEVAAGHDHRMTYRMLTSDGKVIWIENVVTVDPREGRPPLLRGIMVDITERMQTQETLKAAQLEAVAASKAKSAFLANMSHEIRTPLTAILGYTDLLRENGNAALPAEQRNSTLETIRNAGAHMLAIINDILDLSKIEADKLEVEKVVTPLIGILREVECLMRPRAIGKGVALNAKLLTPLPERVMSDPTRLRQILLNIVGNSVKFTEGGSVDMSARSEVRNGHDKLVIDIEDTGMGITQEQQDRLFQVFGQGDESMNRKHGGTGLGLAVSRKFAGLLGGTITLARTELGKGSCFQIELPLEPAPGSPMVERLEAVQEASVLPLAAPVARLSGRILLAEDGPDNQRLIAFHLKKAGATVGVAENGQIALEMLDKASADGVPFDMLLTDMQMPVMDGYTLASTLRSRASTLPIVALTAHAMAEDRARCLNAGCDDYATKPIDRAALIATCSKWMSKPAEGRLAA